MKVLVIGSGAREHALVWKIRQSPLVDRVFCAPGNAGIGSIAELVQIEPTNYTRLTAFALQNKIDLSIPGPENSLELGLVDLFQEYKLKIFGPTQKAAVLETSKVRAKQIMQQSSIPTTSFKHYRDYHEALNYISECKHWPIVIKADGLAEGKGVFVCRTPKEAETALYKIMHNPVCDGHGDLVLIEDFLEGSELSVHAICDGADYILLPPTKDYKVFNGLNTGGMGTISAPWITKKMMGTIAGEIVEPILKAMVELKASFRGCLYPGLMLTKTGPQVLEFNVRFGDPETQVLMRKIDFDLVELFLAAIDHSLKNVKLKIRREFVINVVLASGGYPEKCETGLRIYGIEEAEKIPGVKVFHASTALKYGQLVTNGGRVLSVTASGNDPEETIKRVYKAVDLINFGGKSYLKNIGEEFLPSKVLV